MTKPAVAGTLDAPADPADVAMAYRLLLGREPAAAEVAAGDGQSLSNLLYGVLDSAEHTAFVRTPLLAGVAFAEGRYRTPPENEAIQWLERLLGEEALPVGVRASWPSMVARARNALSLQLEPGLTDATAALDLPTRRDDVERLYRLVLGREMESEAVLVGRLQKPVFAVAAELLSSDEFRVGQAEKIVLGWLGGEADTLPIADLGWARRRLGLDLSSYTSRKTALAALLEMPDILRRLDKTSLAWSTAALVKFLSSHEELDAEEAQRSSAIEAMQRLSHNVELLGLRDIELTLGGVRFTSDDPNVTFRLDPQAAAGAAAVELVFAMGGARRRAAGVLYVDYGEGFPAGAILLTPRSRRLHRAVVMHPGRVKALRWDPDNQAGEAALLSLAARPLPRAELQGLIAALPPDELFADPAATPASADADLSRRLTMHAHGHGSGRDYGDWIAAFEPTPLEAQRKWADELAALTAAPLISVLVPLYDTPADLLRAMIESVLNQVYPHWELCLADDASPASHVREIVTDYMAQDTRIKCVFRPRNGHISAASNSALELATGEWLALMDHDDVLTPDALLAVAGEIGMYPHVQFIYSDEDKLDDRGLRHSPFFKPDFSPELLRSQNYLNHLSVHRTANVRTAGGWRRGYEGSQDYDLNLRTLERLPPSAVRHIPRVLYHWRAVAGSTSLAIDEKSYAVEAGLKALREHVERMGWDASASMVPGLPFFRVRYHVPEPAPLVSIVIPTRDRADLLGACVDSVLRETDYPVFEILIADNGSVKRETFTLFERLTRDPRVRVVATPGPFNYSRINNAAVRETRGDLLCLLNNDIEVITPGWMREMAGWALQRRIGCVGAKLYYPDDTIQHAGVILGIGGVAGHSHKTFPRKHSGYFSRIMLAHDISAVTGACLLVRRNVWDEVSGLNEALTVAFNDVDFCLRVREAGYRNVFTPFAEMYHHESPSRGLEDSPEKVARFNEEIQIMEQAWEAELLVDPYYSPNLTLTGEDFSLR